MGEIWGRYEGDMGEIWHQLLAEPPLEAQLRAAKQVVVFRVGV